MFFRMSLLISFLVLAPSSAKAAAGIFDRPINCIMMTSLVAAGITAYTIQGISIAASSLGGTLASDVSQSPSPSDKKDKVTYELIGGSVSYGIASIAGIIASSLFLYYARKANTVEENKARILRVLIPSFISTSFAIVGLGLNSDAYKNLSEEKIMENKERANALLATSITGTVIDLLGTTSLLYDYLKYALCPDTET